MKISTEKINEQKDNEILINSNENKKIKAIETDKNIKSLNYDLLINLLTNEEIYSKIQNIKEIIKLYHKSIIKNIGLMIQELLKNSNINKYEFIKLREKNFTIKSDNYSGIESYINLLHQIDLVHNNFYSDIKKILLKINKHYKKRNNKIKKYNEANSNNYSFYFQLLSKLFNGKYNANEHYNENKINLNPCPVIINNIQNEINIIKRTENEENDLFSKFNNKFLNLLKENEIIEKQSSKVNLIEKNNKYKFFNYLEIKKEYFFELKSNKNKININFSFIITKVISNFKILKIDNKGKNNEVNKSDCSNFNELLIQKDSEIYELKNKNKLISERISIQEKKINNLSIEKSKLKSELISDKKTIYTLKFKIKQNEKTISNLTKQNENINKSCREEKTKYDNEIKNFNIDLTKSNIENKKLSKYLNSLEFESNKIFQSFNDLNKTHIASNKDLNQMKSFHRILENDSDRKKEELNSFHQFYSAFEKLENEKNKTLIEKYSTKNESNEVTNDIDCCALINQNEKLKNEIKKLNEKIVTLNKKIEHQNEQIIYYKSSLAQKSEKYINLEKKYNEINKKLEEIQKINYSTNTMKRTFNINENNNNVNDITPIKYNLIKYIEIDGMKWYLFKKKNIQISQRTHYYSRHQRLKTLNNINELQTKDKAEEYIWKPSQNSNEFKDFNFSPKDEQNVYENKINNLEKNIQELKEKLNKKEEDFNRVNINYVKLLKKAKNPDNNQEKMLEEINYLKKENKKLNNSINKLQSEKNVIGLSFIEDDLEGSFFIDNFSFDKILEEIDKYDNKFMAMNNTIQKHLHPNSERNIDDIKLENTTNNNL